MYHDLGLAHSDAEASLHRERICSSLSLGYSTVASTTTAAERLAASSRCSTSRVDDASIAAGGVHLHRQMKLGGSFRPGRAGHVVLRQLSRLNFIASETAQTQQLSASPQIVKSYDLVCVVPRSERVLQQVGAPPQGQPLTPLHWRSYPQPPAPLPSTPRPPTLNPPPPLPPPLDSQACSSLDVEIISLELWQRLPFKLKPAVLKAALSRGVFFEVCYAPALREPSARRHLFANAQALVRATRGRNIIVSSGARWAGRPAGWRLCCLQAAGPGLMCRRTIAPRAARAPSPPPSPNEQLAQQYGWLAQYGRLPGTAQ
jgi:ribonuclease P/MRP protein subunit RPP1